MQAFVDWKFLIRYISTYFIANWCSSDFLKTGWYSAAHTKTIRDKKTSQGSFWNRLFYVLTSDIIASLVLMGKYFPLSQLYIAKFLAFLFHLELGGYVSNLGYAIIFSYMQCGITCVYGSIAKTMCECILHNLVHKNLPRFKFNFQHPHWSHLASVQQCIKCLESK